MSSGSFIYWRTPIYMVNLLPNQVPVGNFEVDWLIHTADIFFSRALRDQQQVIEIFTY